MSDPPTPSEATPPDIPVWECANCGSLDTQEEAPPGWFLTLRVGWKPDLVTCSRVCLAQILDDVKDTWYE